MTRRTLARLAASVGCTLLLSGAFSATAAAIRVAAPTFGSPDVSTPGLVTLPISSPGAPDLRIVVGDAETYRLHLTADSGNFTFATGGYGSSTTVVATACSNTACSQPTAPLTVFPTDVVPDFAWPTDRALGPNETAEVVVNDDLGPGFLAVSIGRGSDPLAGTRIALTSPGTTTIPVPLGASTLSLIRCRFEELRRCTAFTPNQQIAVSRIESVLTAWPSIPPITSTDRSTTIKLRGSLSGLPFPEGATATTTWSLRSGGVVRRSGTLTKTLTATSTSLGDLVVNGAGLPERLTTLVATVTVNSTEYGSVTDSVTGTNGRPSFEIDRTPPVATVFRSERSTIFPYATVRSLPRRTEVLIRSTSKGIAGVVVFSGSKSVVQLRARETSRSQRITWSGRFSDGTKAPPGTYTLRLRDRYGNIGEQKVVITVSSKRR